MLADVLRKAFYAEFPCLWAATQPISCIKDIEIFLNEHELYNHTIPEANRHDEAKASTELSHYSGQTGSWIAESITVVLDSVRWVVKLFKRVLLFRSMCTDTAVKRPLCVPWVGDKCVSVVEASEIKRKALFPFFSLLPCISPLISSISIFKP